MSLNYCFSWIFALRNWKVVQVESVRAAVRLRWMPTYAAPPPTPGRGSSPSVRYVRCSGLCHFCRLYICLVPETTELDSPLELSVEREARKQSFLKNISFCLGSSHLLRSQILTPAAAPLQVRCGKNASSGANLTSRVVVLHIPTSPLCYEKVSEVSSKVIQTTCNYRLHLWKRFLNRMLVNIWKHNI